MIEMIKKFIRDEEGQDLVEYALLLVFIALAAIIVLPTWVARLITSLADPPAP